MGTELEMAVVIGTDELNIIAAAAAFPYLEDEFDFAGGLRMKAVELMQCRSVDIEVPSDSEIVLEGKTSAVRRNLPYVQYNQYLEKRWPIGTRVVEGACGHLVKD